MKKKRFKKPLKNTNDGKGHSLKKEKIKCDYELITKTNNDFEIYYKAQEIVDPSDWDTFMTVLKKELPVAFRINKGCLGQAVQLRNMILGGQISSFSGDYNQAIKPLSWDTDGFSFQTSLSKIEIKKSEELLKFHNFLISESENGYLTRQETVSMIPPLVLDVQPHHKILDACAAPGSKTAQIIEMLYSVPAKGELSSRDKNQGIILANDMNNKRCYMLVHQAKRLHSPYFVIINHDAGAMPNFYLNEDGQKKLFKFDRILCDTSCTGDGTIRKNYDVWAKWKVANGINFHPLQIRIAKRCLELLIKDGLMVYSTCSLNPLENEAVISSLLVQSKGGLELVDVSDKLPGLKYKPGLKKWIVMQKDLKIVNNISEVDKESLTHIKESMFPPQDNSLNLERCIRILPHLQNTGGFFVAVLKKKVDTLAWEQEQTTLLQAKSEPLKSSSNLLSERKIRNKLGFREDPFYFFTEENTEWIEIKKFYKISDQFPFQQLVHRSLKAKRNIYFLTDSAKTLIVNNKEHVKFINAGVRLFSKIDDKVCDCKYRITQEGLATILPYLDKDILVQINKEEFKKLLLDLNDHSTESFSELVREKLNSLSNGCCVIIYNEPIFKINENDKAMIMTLPIVCWKGKTTLRPFISKSERTHFLRICGIDTSSLEQAEISRFKERHERKLKRLESRNQKLKLSNDFFEVPENFACDEIKSKK